MSISHAVVWTDHKNARVLQLEAAQAEPHKLRANSHYTRQHHSDVRTEHEFFGDVCDAVKDFDEVLVTGSRTALADFRHYAEKHRPHVAARIAGYEVVDHPSDPQLIALARKQLLKHDRMNGVTNPF